MKRPALFSGYCVDNGVKRRLTQTELRELWRLWRKHADIRAGALKA